MADRHQIETHYRTCNICEAMCGLVITHQDGNVLSIKGDRDDPLSRGHVCPKAVALQDLHADPDRLKKPVKRTKNGWETIGWEEAFTEVTERLSAILEKYGSDSIGVYQGNPTVHNAGSLLFAPDFFKTLKTRNVFSATSVDQLPHHLASYLMFGHQLLLPVPDIDRTSFLLIIGANPLVSNGSLMTAPGFGKRLKKLQERGGRFVVIDPRRTETAAKADRHLYIRPGTDVLLLLSVLHVLFSEDLVRPGRLAAMVDGLGEVQTLVRDFPPDSVAEKTGIEADHITKLARDFASAKGAACYGRLGVSTQEFGSLCQWLVNVLNVVTGNLDREGGSMFTLPAIDIVDRAAKEGRMGSMGRWHSRVRGLPEINGELPAAVMAQEILTQGKGQIKAMVTSAGNPVLSSPNGPQLDQALGELEFMVSVDIYINETTRHADIVLPPTTGLETDHYDLAFHLFTVSNTAKYSPALFLGAEGSRHDWEIFKALAVRMSAKRKQPSGWKARLGSRLQASMTTERMLDVGLRLGPYGALGGRFLSRNGLSIRRLKKHPHGIHLSRLKPCLPDRLYHNPKRIQLAPEALVKDVGRARSLLADVPRSGAKEFDLSLIGRRHLRSNNSWLHNSQRLVKGPNRCTLLMHPGDAAARGISDSGDVVVESQIGRVTIQVEISDEMLPGVVSIPHGWGHGHSEVKLRVAGAVAGVSINVLTDHQRIDPLSGNAAFSDVPVRVTKG